MKYTLITILFFCSSICVSIKAQSGKKETPAPKPKLIVGIVVDQMRNDYIYRYWNRFGNGGFKKLINNGYYLKNAHFNYIPTYTGPGHSTIYTGATPRVHGIIANDWYEKKSNSMVYCVEDANVISVGAASLNGKKSPIHQLSSTIGDELKISSNGKSKVFGIALKDRSSILPAGHAADAAFWYNDSSGHFISSSWYVNTLPNWVNEFNAKNYAIKELEKGWNTKYAIETYTNSIKDNNSYEKAPNKKETPTFPYEYKAQLQTNNLAILKATPYGNSITKDFALACLKNEKLGKDEFTDILAISFSSPDIIAHSFGPRSIEIEDVYLRLDAEIEELIKELDKEVGAANYVIFLTADHGAADVPNHLIDNKIPAGFLSSEAVASKVKTYLQKNYNDSTILLNCSNEQLFLDETKITKLNQTEVEQNLANFLITISGVMEAYPSLVIKNNSFDKRDIRNLIQNGYKHTKSGNVAFVLNPAWMDYGKKGTTHGAAYSYDTHVPLIFYGAKIKKGSSLNYVRITQIAPTLSDLIQINYPNGCVDDPLDKLIKKGE